MADQFEGKPSQSSGLYTGANQNSFKSNESILGGKEPRDPKKTGKDETFVDKILDAAVPVIAGAAAAEAIDYIQEKIHGDKAPKKENLNKEKEKQKRLEEKLDREVLHQESKNFWFRKNL